MFDHQYVVTVINTSVRGGQAEFGRRPGPTKFLKVPTDEVQSPSHQIPKTQWVDEVIAGATTGEDPMSGNPTGHILLFIHGYNNSQEVVIQRHRRLQADLHAEGFRGLVVSFDWPSAEKTLLYMRDRRYAKRTAERLTDDCIRLFSARQERGCDLSVHVLGHSTGAHVIRHAFDDADECEPIKNRAWKVGQIVFIGGDVSACSMSADDARATSIYRHCSRLTNYQSGYDRVLKVSNAKRVGLRPRVGRVGLPDDAHEKAVNVDCSDYFAGLNPDDLSAGEDFFGSFPHSWHIGNRLFTRDLAYTLQGDVDRYSIPTREKHAGRLRLRPGV